MWNNVFNILEGVVAKKAASPANPSTRKNTTPDAEVAAIFIIFFVQIVLNSTTACAELDTLIMELTAQMSAEH